MKYLRILTVFVAIIMAGCATPPSKTIKSNLDGKSLLLIVAVEDQFILRKDGFTVFEHKEQKINLEKTSIANDIEKIISSELSQKFIVKIIEPERRAEFNNIKPYWTTNFNKINSQREFIKNLAQKEGVETILIIGSSCFPTIDMYNPVCGNGIYQVNVFGKKRMELFYTARAVLFDGETAKEHAADQISESTKINEWYDLSENVNESDLDPWKDQLVSSIVKTTKTLLHNMGVYEFATAL